MNLYQLPTFFMRFVFLGFISLLTGCSSYGVITNAQQDSKSIDDNYSIKQTIQAKKQGDVTLVLALSGGGTRAAALAYGVLEELKATPINGQQSLLDELDIISAVSGGSFTAAYYGLNGNKTFKNFKKDILLTDIEADLLTLVLNPIRWFSNTGRTQLAIEYYNLKLFGGKTFKDLNKPGRPLVLINASDLSNGVRFSFVQEYFDLICSDIKDLPIAKAVAASSAVPIIFNPVVLQNYQPCDNGVKQRLKGSLSYVKGNEELINALSGLREYTDTHYPYLHLVDGGITDNLGLRAVYEAIELSGGPKSFLKKVNKSQTKHIVVISVDASTRTGLGINQSNKVPTSLQNINAMTDIQLHRYNTATKTLFEESLIKWSKQLSTPKQQVKTHFISLNFDGIKQPELRKEFNLIPTSLTLTEEQIDKLINAGSYLLKNNFGYQQLLQTLDEQDSKTHR